jgi:AAA domain
MRERLEQERIALEAARVDRPRPELRLVGSERGQTEINELEFSPARLPNPHEIPPRRWLYGTTMLRGFFTVLVAPGGVGKTAYAMGIALALASGRALFGDKVFERVNVAVLNLEDPLEEIDRRLAAAMLLHKVSADEVEGRYFVFSADERRLSIAAVASDGTRIIFPDKAAIIQQIRTKRIGALIVDPYVESHELDENSNPQMALAASAWRDIARETGCAIFLIHHVRKGMAADIDASRGAKALTDSARVGILMTTMTEEEARQHGVKTEDRHAYIRVLDAKANMARRDGDGRWLKIESIELGNGTAMYPAGDHVAAVRQWIPPSPFEGLTVEQCNLALDQIEAGPEKGVRYAATKRGKTNSRWAGSVLVDGFAMDEERAARIIKTWIENGVLEVRSYDDERQRKAAMGLFLVAAKRPGGMF